MSQLCKDGKWHPIAYYSKSLSEVERNYDIHDKELLAIIRALEEWRYLLEGAPHCIEILTDHRNLTYFTMAQKLNRRQARWSLFLSRFDFTITHRPGKSSGKPDALSRQNDYDKGEEDNKDMVLLTPNFFAAQATSAILMEGIDVQFMERIRNCPQRDTEVVKAFRESKEGRGVLRASPYTETDGIVLYEGKVYVPKDAKLRYDIVKSHHDSAIAGHPGRWKTQELVSCNYWWPGLSRYISNYVKGCDLCNRTKIYPTTPAGPLIPNSIPSYPWQIVTTDLITKLPMSQGFNSIWVAVDRFSKRMHLAATTEEVDSVGVARLFRDNVWKHHGLPEQIISDRGSQFISKFTKELNRLLGIQGTPSTAFHPQTDGQTERVNQEIEQYLRMFVNQRQDDWAEWLPLVEFAYNNRIHSSTRQTPFEVDTGRHPRMGIEPHRTSKIEAAEEFTNRMKQVIEETRSALKQAALDMSRHYNAHHQHSHPFKKGDKVWLDSRNIKTTRPTKKLDDKWFGPFEIEEVLPSNACRLKLTPAFRNVHPVFNTTLLRLYQDDLITARPQPTHPPPDIDEEGEEAYEVEKILDSKYSRGRLEYLVKWKGYGPEHNSWEPESNLNNAPQKVAQFHRTHPTAPRRISVIEWQKFPFKRLHQYTEPQPLFDWQSESTS